MSENALKRIKSAAPAKFQGLPPRPPLISSQMKVTGCNLAKLPAVKPPQLVISRRFTPPESRSCTTTPKLAPLHQRRVSKQKTPHSVRQSYERNVKHHREPVRGGSVVRVPYSDSPSIISTTSSAPKSSAHLHSHSESSRAYSAGAPLASPSSFNTYDPREIKLRKALIELAPPIITSKAWSIVNGRTTELLFGKLDQERREFASLTKIMTLHVVLELVQKYSLDLQSLQITVSKRAARINGTSACVRAGDTFTCYDLLFGMMLPSGNDVALLFAEFFGRLLLDSTPLPASLRKRASVVSLSKGSKQSQSIGDSINAQLETTETMDSTQSENQDLLAIDRFIYEMNSQAKKMGLKMTHFANPHGLSNHHQKSTPAELGKMTAITMQNPIFRKVCSTRFYSCRPLNDEKYIYRWTNTHKMLDMSGYNGVKTGITPAAGPCLATSYQVKDTHLIVILLDSKTMEHRWNETAKLVSWCQSRLKRAKQIFGIGSVGEECEQLIRKIKNIQTPSCT